MGLTQTQLVRLLLADPLCLTCALANLQRKHRFLVAVMGLGAVDVVDRCPSFFSASLLHAIAPRFRFVDDHGLRHALGVPSPAQEGGAGCAPSPAVVATQTSAEDGHRRRYARVADMGAAPGGGSLSDGDGQSAGEGAHSTHSTTAYGHADEGGDDRLHLGLLLHGSDDAFCARVGVQPADFQAFAQAWLLGEGLDWAGMNTPFSPAARA